MSCLQWQTYGYIPSALPDSNCFGGQQAEPQQRRQLQQQPQIATGYLGALAGAPAVEQASFAGQLQAPELDHRKVGGLPALARPDASALHL